jgi:AraC-like DNA-binding protein/quercetin dioxygenase-like cupin family protein
LRSYGDGAIVVTAFGPSGGRFDLHRHDRSQLAWASSGILTVSADRPEAEAMDPVADLAGTDPAGFREDRASAGVWVLPPSRALWIPAGIEHVMDADRRTTLCCPYFDAARGPDWSVPTVIRVTPLARELILHLAGADLGAGERHRAEEVLLDQLTPVPVTTIAVPMPRDPRAIEVARGIIADPADRSTLEQWGRRAGASTRTLARLFAAETGMSFARWRTQARLRAALPLLAAGVPVATTARRVGYLTPSGFVAVFHAATGVPPAAYFTDR